MFSSCYIPLNLRFSYIFSILTLENIHKLKIFLVFIVGETIVKISRKKTSFKNVLGEVMKKMSE